MKFGTILKSLRAHKRVSQIALAKALGVSRSTIGMYESGQREPDFEILKALADYFEVTTDHLLGISSNAPINKQSPTNIVRIAGRDGSYTEKHLTDDQLQLLRLMIDQMPDYKD